MQLLVGPATAARRLRALFVDGDGRRAPVLLPISDIPLHPDGTVGNLAAVLAGVVADLATDAGRGAPSSPWNASAATRLPD